MKTQFYIFLLFLIAYFPSYSQVSISSAASPPDPSAMLDIMSSSKGALIPRMKMAQRDAIVLPQNSLLIFQIDVDPGYYYNNGTPSSPNWIKLLTSSSAATPCDGRIEINTLPYSITTSGSYFVSKHLVGASGINIQSNNVTIDLNGYSLVGSSSTTPGIKIDGSFSKIAIFNGAIMGWDAQGIDGENGMNLNFRDLFVTNNGDDGISAGDNAFIRNCITTFNFFNGISAKTKSMIETCTSNNNSGDGIYVTFSGLVQNCNSSNNQNNGISALKDIALINNNVTNNSKEGLFLNNYCKVTGNVINTNNRNGIHVAGSHNFVENNKVSSNIFDGITCLGLNNTIIANECSNNANGYSAIVNGNNAFFKNTAVSNIASNFAITPGNHFAPVITPATLAGATNPFSNLSY